jgi:PAS domain S-box-containing protein
MGVSARTRPDHAVDVYDGVPAAVAVVDEHGSLAHATSAFIERFEVRDGSLTPCPAEVELVACGQADALTATLDSVEASLVAVVDGDGRRATVITVAATRDAGRSDPVESLLEEPLDESPAIVWLKDLDGRYLYVNRRYTEQLGTDAETVRGHTDVELTAAKSIEGLRLEERETAGREPLELEYMIGAFEERPAFAALRFALRDGEGQPTAVCGVAAPLTDASLARSECERLMRVDRWRRLDAFAIRQELLDDWGLTLADGSSGPPLDRDDRVAAVLVERDDALGSTARLEEELSQEREQRDRLKAESERAAMRADELAGAVTAEQERAGELEQSLARTEARVSELEAEVRTVREELDQQVHQVEALEQGGPVREDTDPDWDTSSQRAFSAALGGLTEWRSVLDHAVDALGSQGGWDAAVAWCRDDARASMRCGAVWMREPGALATFASRTWHHRQDVSSGEFGRARNRMATTCVLELRSAEDPVLRAAAEDGMGSALLVPINDGGETIAMLELLSRSDTVPSAELTVSLEGIALQLGFVAQLLKLADVPRWRIGRL